MTEFCFCNSIKAVTATFVRTTPNLFQLEGPKQAKNPLVYAPSMLPSMRPGQRKKLGVFCQS